MTKKKTTCKVGEHYLGYAPLTTDLVCTVCGMTYEAIWQQNEAFYKGSTSAFPIIMTPDEEDYYWSIL